ncbi:methyltransferase [Vibrio sp. V27_P1S3P104]|uniref:methyltransferase n=1 Tax=unclassified Vibrio TaxID=2614977 RepID=UPI00137271AC|nr:MULTISPECIES: methyltransferase [unclassified Vibrio]NAW68185.1 methyltransferase [Vibrio sp. V28_P6S34P95]NAX04429.1 methyltransferase [Vibrio sp. V30_P3S12P165]NAX34829.1 methyltransferase [Vibrio sp. V29_P1S30P107]NAX37300.1 methyltransferase [Vibrio sp. V27_P1S3P104]NAX40112.1 methyltransferase [Vibrio sp. V26_P1S5P106]
MRDCFQYIDTYLSQTQPFWRFEPFHDSGLATAPWSSIAPELEAWLSTLSNEQVAELKQQPEPLIAMLSVHIPKLDHIVQSLRLLLSNGQSNDFCEAYSEPYPGVPGRKFVQIKSLGAFLVSRHQGEAWLEWCSGKGYLGRWLASHSSHPVVSFEYQEALCEQGQLEADRLGLRMNFVQGDALDVRSQRLFKAHQHAVALHACGDLHVRLLQYAVTNQLAAITFSPCCYHLIEGEYYSPLSQLAKRSALNLTRNELRIPLQETVTGGERVKRHRWLEMTYRLGWDELLKAELGYQEYLPTPSVKKSQLNEGFEAFCCWAAAKKGMTLPTIHFEYYHQKGIERFWKMERLSLVQHGFQRLLELWLVLDRALFLQEQGYRVEIGEFCRRAITPRNLVIHAQKDNRVSPGY